MITVKSYNYKMAVSYLRAVRTWLDWNVLPAAGKFYKSTIQLPKKIFPQKILDDIALSQEMDSG